MNKVLNYIYKGKGVGAIILLFVSVIFAGFIGIMSRRVADMSVPYIQMVADDVLPLMVDNGTVINPVGVKKVFPIFVDDKEMQYSFIFDTTTDTLDEANSESGVYLTRTHLYAVNKQKGEIKSQKLQGSFMLEKKDYTQLLKSKIKWIVITIFAISTVCLFAMYFILNIFYAYCTSIATKITNKQLNFDTKMRLSAICFSVVLLVSFALNFVGVYINVFLFFALVIALQVFLLKKTPQQ